MIKAQEIAAVRLTLADGTEAVFVQEGAAWNKLTELRCVAPAALTGQIIITAPEAPAPGGMSLLFERIFGPLAARVVVMASPGMAAELERLQPGPQPGGDQQ